MNEDFFNLEDLKLGEATIEQITNTEEAAPEGAADTDSGEINLEEEKPNTEQEVKDITPSTESTNDSSTFSVFANLLKEEGVLSLDDEDFKDVKTAADLKELVAKQIEKSRLDHMSESQKRYHESVKAGLPQSEFEKIEKQLSSLEAINDETLENDRQARFDLIAYDYIERGISKEEAVDLANRSIRLETDVEDSRKALRNLIVSKSEQYKNAIVKKTEENTTSLEKLKSTIDSKESILKDIKLNAKSKEDIYNLLSVKVDSDASGQPLNEFNKWKQDNGLEADIILGALYNATNKFQNLGKILDTSKSKASVELEKRLRQNEINEISNSFMKDGGKYEINI
jgi:hypothetical protein